MKFLPLKPPLYPSNGYNFHSTAFWIWKIKQKQKIDKNNLKE